MSGTKPTIKRQKKDIQSLLNTDFSDSTNIFSWCSPSNIRLIYSVIVGPDDTPYAGGFFLFKTTFEDDYPFKHPMTVMRTLDPRVRFHPNLYRDGKVCLSLIGTWAQNDNQVAWTPAMTLITLLTTVQSMMGENAERNEPGHETRTPQQCKPYDDTIKWFTQEVAVLGMLKRNVDGEFTQELKTAVEKHFVKNIDKYHTRMDKYIDEYEGKTLPGAFDGNNVPKCEYKKLKTEMTQIYESIKSKYA